MRVEGAREFRISEGATRVHVSVVLRLLTDVDGLEGNAEVVSAPPGKPEEFLEEIVGAIERYVAPALVGMPVRERGRAVQAVAMALKGRVWTKAAVTNALYDLHAKAIGVPVADLLGGQLLQRVPVIGPVVGIMTPDAMAKEAAAQSAAGFLAIKIKVGETVEADIDRVAAVRAAIGESMSLRVDANDHYCRGRRDPAHARDRALSAGTHRAAGGAPRHARAGRGAPQRRRSDHDRRHGGDAGGRDERDPPRRRRSREGQGDQARLRRRAGDLRDAVVGRTDAGPRPRVRNGPRGHCGSAVRGMYAGTCDALRDRLDGADGNARRHRHQRSRVQCRDT